MSFNSPTDTLISPTTEEGVPIRKLFIGNLAERTTIKDLQKLFANFGQVERSYLKRNVGKSNFAFVTFSDVEGAIKAREAAYKMQVQLHCRILRVSTADTWHQPDSVENQRKYVTIKDSSMEEEIIENNRENSPEPNNSPIQILNDDCLVEIFLYLPVADRVRMERVCKRWQALSQESWRAVKKLNLSKNTWGLSPKIRIQAVDTGTLRKVLIKCGQFLTHLDLSELPHQLSTSTLTIVGKFCPNLQHVNVTAIELSPSGIFSLMTNCKNMNKFIMKSLTGPCEKDLSQLFLVNKKLKYLAIDGDDSITGKCLAYLPDEIEEIHLQWCTSILSPYLDSAIEKFNNLTSFTLSSCVCVTESTMKVIGQITTIINLELSGAHPMITADSLNHLSNLLNLKRLCLKNSAANDEFLINITRGCKGLNYLDISDCQAITNIGIASLASLPQLEALVINWDVQVTDTVLGDLHNLKTLECHGCNNIKDGGITTLIEMAPNLLSLDLSGCSITNSTLEAAIIVTKQRKNNKILKIIVGGNKTNVTNLSEVSPLLQIINVDLSLLARTGSKGLLDWSGIHDAISKMGNRIMEINNL